MRTSARPHLGELLAPRTIAIVGASRNPNSLSGRYLDHLVRHGFDGTIIPINRSASEVGGYRAFASLDELDEPVDLALVTVPGDDALAAARTAAAQGVPLTVMFSSGFAETGSEGKLRQEELRELFSGSQGRLLGPNCPGFINTSAGVVATVSAFAGGHDIPAGPIGIVSQSGAVGGLVAERMLDAGSGLSHLVFTGNEADTELAEVVEALALDDTCRVIACFVEGIQDPVRMMDALRTAAANEKPVLVLSVGRSDESRRAVALHTGKLVAVGDAERALFVQFGATLVDDLTELAEAASALAVSRRRAGGRVGVVSTTGGLGGLVADEVRRAGCALPPLPAEVGRLLAADLPTYASTQNPCDFADALTTREGLLQDAIAAFAGAGCYDVLVVTMGVHPGWLADRLAGDLVEAIHACSLPVLVLWPGGSMGVEAVRRLRAEGCAVFESTRAVGAALKALDRRSPALFAEIDHATTAGGVRERDVKAALEAVGLTAPRAEVVHDARETADALARLGGTCVLKVHEPVVDHKARLGLIRRGIVGDGGGAWVNLAAAAAKADLELVEALLEEQVQDLGPELLVSCRRSALGLELLVSAGGGSAELACRRALRIGPVGDDEVSRMAKEINLDDTLHASLQVACHAVQSLALAYGDELAVLELNPVLLTHDRAVVLDAKLRLG